MRAISKNTQKSCRVVIIFGGCRLGNAVIGSSPAGVARGAGCASAHPVHKSWNVPNNNVPTAKIAKCGRLFIL
jgi:hypothetical protein